MNNLVIEFQNANESCVKKVCRVWPLKDRVKTKHDLGKLEKWSEIMKPRRNECLKTKQKNWLETNLTREKCTIEINEKVNIFSNLCNVWLIKNTCLIGVDKGVFLEYYAYLGIPVLMAGMT